MNRIDEIKAELADLIDDFIRSKLDTECPHCQRELIYPNVDEIEDWLEEEI